MLNPKAIRTISDIREDPMGVIKAAESLGEPIWVFYRATPTGVFMGLKQYQRLTSLVTDYHDSLRMKEALEDPDAEWVTLETMWKDHGFAKHEPNA